MDIAILVTIALAVVGAIGGLAFKDPDAYKRLFKFLKGQITIVSNFAAGVFLGAFLVKIEPSHADTIITIAICVGAAAIILAGTLVFFIWLRNDFARYADKD